MINQGLTEQARQLEHLVPKLMRQLFALDVNDPTIELPVVQLRVCAILTDGPITISALAKHLGNSVSAATQIADRLESLGIVERTPELGDRRKRVLRLTKHGAEILRQRRERRVMRAIRALKKLSPARREAVFRALQALLAASSSVAPGSSTRWRPEDGI